MDPQSDYSDLFPYLTRVGVPIHPPVNQPPRNAYNIEDDLELLKKLKPTDEQVRFKAERDLSEIVQSANDTPVINLVNKILALALDTGVSDIHIEPQEEKLRVRFRKDGILYDALNPLPKSLMLPVAARLKIIANLDIAERRAPQDGRIQRLFEGRRVDFRVSVMPSRYGEKIVLRILDNSGLQLGLDGLISDTSCLQIIRDMSSRSFGLLLCTGPTGSGKSTTLYSILSERNLPEINICTIEDPIEYSLPGITQVQVLREKNVTFSSALRSFLRQDPDIILVGETRDPETAKTSAEAAMTGHLVLTSLHTNDAVGAIARLGEMGVEPFMLANFLIGVVAQRLVRRVCQVCRIPIVDSVVGNSYKANLKSQCKSCNGRGYKGRCGVYEVMRVNSKLQKLIATGSPSWQIEEVAVESGMKSLLDYGLELVSRGETTLDEVRRVIV